MMKVGIKNNIFYILFLELYCDYMQTFDQGLDEHTEYILLKLYYAIDIENGKVSNFQQCKGKITLD